jgi:hypothetical protein
VPDGRDDDGRVHRVGRRTRGTVTTATLPPLSGVRALHDSAGGVILNWDDNAFSGDEERYVIERTVNGVTTIVDGGDGIVREHSAAPPLTTSSHHHPVVGPDLHHVRRGGG